MKLFLVSSLVAAVSAYAPVTFQENNGPACGTIKCAPIECQPPFKWVNAKDAGTCCPVCTSDS
jgi:hypothetical protein